MKYLVQFREIIVDADNPVDAYFDARDLVLRNEAQYGVEEVDGNAGA